MELDQTTRMRLVEAFRASGPPQKAPAPAPTVYAMSADPCPRCGVPGIRGCEHQLPYQRPDRSEFGPDRNRPSLSMRRAFQRKA